MLTRLQRIGIPCIVRQEVLPWRKCSRSVGSRTPACLAKVVMKVPTMGDSITEGTIVEWSVAVGQAVKEGDVVALVETDKVTVDIKAEADGVLTQQFGAIDETVEVGAKLYEIDTEAEVQVTTVLPNENASQSGTTAEPIQSASETITATHIAGANDHSRTPSISFLGKQGWFTRLSGTAHQPASATPEIPVKPNAVVVLNGSMLPARFGRPDFSEEEMEALILGGANVAPSVVVPSSGAVFSAAYRD